MINGSVSDKAGMAVEDEVLSINGKPIKNTINDYLSENIDQVTFQVKRRFKTNYVTLKTGRYYSIQQLQQLEATDELKLLRKVWSK